MKNQIEKEVLKETYEELKEFLKNEPKSVHKTIVGIPVLKDELIKAIKLTQQKTAQHYLDEKKWLEFKELKPKKKTKVFQVWSKCADGELGIIKWNPKWRAYCLFVDYDRLENWTREIIFSDRCQLQIGYFTKKLNDEHKNGVK